MEKRVKMKRDMDLVRLILLKIEEESNGTAIYNLNIDGYDMEKVAYHCRLVYEAGLISDYEEHHADDTIDDFAVGTLTWEGHDYLEKVRDVSRWDKIKQILVKNGIALGIDVILTVANGLVKSAAEGAVSAYLKNGAV